MLQSRSLCAIFLRQMATIVSNITNHVLESSRGEMLPE